MQIIKLNMARLMALAFLFLASEAFGVTLSPTTLTLYPSETGSIQLSSISGSISSVISSNANVFTASLSGNRVIVIAGSQTGTARLSVRDRNGSKIATVKVVNALAVNPTSLTLSIGKSARLTLSNISGTLSMSSSNTSLFSYSRSGNVITVTAKKTGTGTLTLNDSKKTLAVPITVTSSITANASGRLLASNCYQCHGTYGSGGFDKIAGKSDLASELNEFLAPNGEHANSIMAAHLKGYSNEQLTLISNYLASLKY